MDFPSYPWVSWEAPSSEEEAGCPPWALGRNRRPSVYYCAVLGDGQCSQNTRLR